MDPQLLTETSDHLIADLIAGRDVTDIGDSGGRIARWDAVDEFLTVSVCSQTKPLLLESFLVPNIAMA